MNFYIIFPRSRQQLIESLEFAHFLWDISVSFGIDYRKTNNQSIKFFFKIVRCWRNWEFKKVSEYEQLLMDYPYWESRQDYSKKIQKFVYGELSISDFILEILYPSLSHQKEASDLIEDSYKIISNGHYYFTKEFNTHDISEGFVIYEKLSI